MSGFHANFWIDIFRRHSHSTSAYKEKPLLVQPLQINIPSIHLPKKGLEKAGKPKEHAGFFPKIKKYLEYTARFGVSLCLVYYLQKTLKKLLYIELEKYVPREKKFKIKYRVQNQTSWNNKKVS